MTPEQFKRLDELFMEGMKVQAWQRTEWIARACPDDDEVRRELEELLHPTQLRDAAATGALHRKMRLPAGVGGRAGPMGSFGPYQILGLIGEGEFALVYLARQRGAVNRRVAIKVIKPGLEGEAILARFEVQRQVLSLLDHRHAAAVLDGGLTPGGQPYLAMELVPGVPITEYCDAHRLSIRERLELFLPVCDAVEDAHRRGVLHLDLKPGNILVTIEESTERAGTNGAAVPVPRVTDFGVARAIGRSLPPESDCVDIELIADAAQYLSPEQAVNSGHDVDTRTDVYSLGSVLYELLAGAQPFDADALRSGGYEGVLRTVRDVDPPRPSTRLSELGMQDGVQVAQRRQTSVAHLEKQLRRELEWIPMKAMAKHRSGRYESVADLARDLRNFLSKRPLLAGPSGAGYPVRRFIRRHRGPVAFGAAGALAVLVGLVGSLLLYGRERESRRRAAAAEASLLAARDLMREAGPIAFGDLLYRTEGCVRCHSVDGTPTIGPTFHRLYGTMQRLNDGSEILVDDAFIQQSIYRPTAKVAAGFRPVMPSFSGALDQQDIRALTLFIMSLNPRTADEARRLQEQSFRGAMPAVERAVEPMKP